MMMPIAPIEKTVSINDVSLSEPSVIFGRLYIFYFMVFPPISKGGPFDSFEEMSIFIHGPHAGKQFMFCWILVKAWLRAIGAMN